MSESTEPVEGQEPEQPSADYSTESLEELEARLGRGEGFVSEEETEPTPEPEPEPEPEVVEAAEEQAEETTPEVAVEEPDETPAEAEPEPEVEFNERQSQIDELRLMLEKSEADRRRAELLQSRDAGLAGHLKQEMAAMRQALERPHTEPDYAESSPDRPTPSIPPSDPQLQSRLVELESEARAGAISAEYGNFVRDKQIPQADQQSTIEKMSPLIKEQWEPYKEQVADMSPTSLRKVLRVVLDSAYAEHKLQELLALRKEAEERKASQVPEKKKAKQAARVSGSGSAPAPRSRPKSHAEMSGDEADAALIAEFGDGYNPGGQR